MESRAAAKYFCCAESRLNRRSSPLQVAGESLLKECVLQVFSSSSSSPPTYTRSKQQNPGVYGGESPIRLSVLANSGAKAPLRPDYPVCAPCALGAADPPISKYGACLSRYDHQRKPTK